MGDFPHNLFLPNPAANAMQVYDHTYEFDELGNILSDNWKDYVYDTATNRLLKHNANQLFDDYTYDVHSNVLSMPHLTSMVWNFSDQLAGAGNGTFSLYYNYDLEGKRSRKVVVKSNIREERYYVGDSLLLPLLTSPKRGGIKARHFEFSRPCHKLFILRNILP